MSINQVPTDKLPEVVKLMIEEIMLKVAPVIEWLSWLVGGLFGLYLIYFLFRLYLARRKVRILKEVRDDVEFLKEHSLSSDELSKLRQIIEEYPVGKTEKTSNKKKTKRKKRARKK